jgi:OmpR family response regulator RpaB
MGRQKISKKNLPINLTNIEYSILKLLIENMGKELSRPVILDNIWGYIPERNSDRRIVDVHISRLRLKLEENPNKPDLILTVRNKGYIFKKH